MIQWIINRHTFGRRSHQQAAIAGDEDRQRQPTDAHNFARDQGACQLDGIIAPQPMLLRQLDRTIEHGPINR